MTDENKFFQINVAIVTISDTRSLHNDKSGDVLFERVKNFGHKITIREILRRFY